VARELSLVTERDDIVIAFGEPEDGPELAAGLAQARSRGALTIAFSELGAEWVLEPPSPDTFVRQELAETLYHVLWELVHVFFEHRGLLEGRTERRSHDAGASSFLYPFLAEREHDLDAVLADVRESVLMKADEVQRLRTATLLGATAVLARRRRPRARASRPEGGCSPWATAAQPPMRWIWWPTSSPRPRCSAGRRGLPWTSRPTRRSSPRSPMTSEPRRFFARQIIAHGRPGDVLVALSTQR